MISTTTIFAKDDILDGMIIGTRGSELALIQTNIIKAAIEQAFPNEKCEVKIIKTEGDVNQSPIPLSTIGKSWFTKEIERELLEKHIDLAVHSLKDLPNELPPDLFISAYLNRENARDVLVSKSGQKFDELPPGAVIGTDSSRRKAQLLNLRNDIEVKSIRGNVPTRLTKLFEGTDYDAIVLAAAGVERLNLSSKITQYFEFSEIIPSPGQGVLAVESRQDDQKITEILKQINNHDTEVLASIEREFSQAVGGGCKMPVGAYAFFNGADIVLLGMVGTLDGKEVVKDSLTASKDDTKSLGTNLARIILDKCSPEVKSFLNEH